MYTVGMLALALLLILLNGVFVAAEFAFVKVRKTQIELLAHKGSRKAKLALFGVQHLDAYLSVCQLGITLASLGLGWLGEPAVAQLLAPLLQASSITSPALVSSLSVAIGFTTITFMHVVFGELVPKSMSIQTAEATALFLAVPMRVFYILWFPVVSIMNSISNGLLRLAGFTAASEAEQSHSTEELRMLIIDSQRGGTLEESEGRMLNNIFSFYNKNAKEIMLHRSDVVAINIGESMDAIVKKAMDSGHTRLPVYDGALDKIVGFIHAKDLLHHNDSADILDCLRVPLYIHESARLDKVLRLMQESRQQFCVVVDEYGSWQGIITMEDMVEIIVGDIQDEFDNEAPEVLPQTDGSLIISAELSLDDLSAHLRIDCEGQDINAHKSVAAHIIDNLGRIPAAGDHIVLCGKLFTVEAMDRHRVRKVRVNDAPADERIRQ